MLLPIFWMPFSEISLVGAKFFADSPYCEKFQKPSCQIVIWPLYAFNMLGFLFDFWVYLIWIRSCILSKFGESRFKLSIITINALEILSFAFEFYFKHAHMLRVNIDLYLRLRLMITLYYPSLQNFRFYAPTSFLIYFTCFFLYLDSISSLRLRFLILVWRFL